jgi:acyl carrier protein
MDEKFTTVLRPHLPFLPADRQLSDSDALRDLGLNSMQAIEVLFTVEDAYGAVIPDDKLNDETFATVGTLWQAVEDAMQGQGTGR